MSSIAGLVCPMLVVADPPRDGREPHNALPRNEQDPSCALAKTHQEHNCVSKTFTESIMAHPLCNLGSLG